MMALDGEIDVSGFTPTQLRLWAVLRDGEPHTQKELEAVMMDEFVEAITVKVHISAMRKRLRQQEHGIMLEWEVLSGNRRTPMYRLVRLLTNYLP